MASRTEQKAAARAAREAKQRQLSAPAAQRRRLVTLGSILGVAVIAVVAVIIVSSTNGDGSVEASKSAQAAAIATVDVTLAGIPQSGNVLGNPNAPVTMTEYGDLACPVCAEFAVTSEPQIITTLVKTGKLKLVYRGLETASGHANSSMYVTTQVAARAAGLQHKEWNYLLLAYQEQPQTIDSTPAEDVSYITSRYLQNLAAQITGLDLVQWQANLVNKTLINEVNADGSAASAAGVTGTPTIFVSGPNGQVEYNKNDTLSAVPTLSQIQALVDQAS